MYVEVLCVVFFFISFEYYNFLYASSFPCIYFKFVSVKVYEVVLLRFDNPLSVEDFCLPKDNKKILSSTPLFYSFQNLVIHMFTLTFGNHYTANSESRIVGSLSFLFGQILARVI